MSNTDDEIESINEEPISEPMEVTEDVHEQLGKMKSEYLYLRAEFDNFRKNSIKERSQLVRFGAEALIRELLEVVDNFDRALEMEITKDTIGSFKQGMDMTATELRAALSKFGVKEDDPTGKAFDPNLHNALSSEPTDQIDPGHVFKVYKKAYLLHDKLIRPAQVIVARELDNSADKSTDDAETKESSGQD